MRAAEEEPMSFPSVKLHCCLSPVRELGAESPSHDADGQLGERPIRPEVSCRSGGDRL